MKTPIVNPSGLESGNESNRIIAQATNTASSNLNKQVTEVVLDSGIESKQETQDNV